ncbi:MAG TPA: sugar phosphate isomerase/epimerase [Cytophagaceae bacterium]
MNNYPQDSFTPTISFTLFIKPQIRNMSFGINTFLFTSPFTDSSTALFASFKRWGFDSVEIALEDPSHIDLAFVKKQLDKHGLVCNSVCAAMGPDRDFRGNKEQQNNSMKYLKGLIDCMETLESQILVGPLYSSVGRANEEAEADYELQWQMVAGHLKTLADYASSKGKKLAIEPLNRFETDFINTCDQGLKMIREVGNSNLSLHLDTFHMNIEEKDSAEAILKAGKHLGHFHASGSDRGTPGKDHINWKSITKALDTINYKGDIVIESFTKDVKVIARAAAIWRQVESSQDEIASDGIKFLKNEFLYS